MYSFESDGSLLDSSSFDEIEDIEIIAVDLQKFAISSKGVHIADTLEFSVTINGIEQKLQSDNSALYFRIKNNEKATIKLLSGQNYTMEDREVTFKCPGQAFL